MKFGDGAISGWKLAWVNKMRNNTCVKNSGFTLIEIVCVLIILSILAAFAGSRYFSLGDKETQKALQGALSEGISSTDQSKKGESKGPLSQVVSLSEQSKQKAMRGALSQGIPTLNMAYGKLKMSGGAVDAASLAQYASNNPPRSDEFSYSFTGTGTVVTVTVRGIGGGFRSSDTASRSWSLPR